MFFPGSRNRNGSCALIRVFAALFCLLTAFSLVSCNMDGDWQDDHKLNPNLVGTWKLSGNDYTDTYTITATTVSHPEGYPAYSNAEIVYVYNFNAGKTAGGLIIKRKEDGVRSKSYNVVWFKDLQLKKQVLLGDAFTVADYTIDPSVASLEEAKSKFAPANATLYGGGDAQRGSPQKWQ